MNESQKIFGTPSDRARDKIKNYMSEQEQNFIRQSPFMVMATSDRDGNCDTSPKGGMPGFVKILDNSRLLIPDVAGNRLFQSYENIETSPKAGLIFFIPGINTCVRVNGRVSVICKGQSFFDKLTLEVFEPDEKAKVLQALVLDVDESYGHCPRALRFSNLWNTDIIQQNLNESPVL